MMSAFHIWKDDPPPINAKVLAKYILDEAWREVTTCKRGCCVYDYFGYTMLLPAYWKELPAPPTGDEK